MIFPHTIRTFPHGRRVFLPFLLLALCYSDPAWARKEKIVRPEWIAQPKTDDSLYLYRVGHATNQPSADTARDAAFQDAVRQVAGIFMPAIRGNLSVTQVMAAVSLRNVDILPDCVHTEPAARGYEGWVQVSYPLAEKQKIIRRIEQGEKADQLWTEANSEVTQGHYEPARKLLKQIVEGRGQALFMTADMDEVRLVLGDTYREQNNALDARCWYESVLHTTASDQWKTKAAEALGHLPDPPRFWPLQDRWNGRKVALLCAIRDDKPCRRFLDLANVLTKDCGEARLDSADIARGLDEESLAACFDKMDFSAAGKAALAQQAGVILAVLFDIDPRKRGTTTQMYGVTIPAMDSMVRFFVVRAEDGRIIYNGQFKETAGVFAESRLADRAAAIMIAKYLAPQCPVIGMPLKAGPDNGK
ncbi:MAG: hypothetical protein WC381_07345 [Kiritimatiellia bacterium]|jgi:hypothetical protein